MFSKIVSSVSSALDFNLATLSGCIDILVVPDENGQLQSTPFHVRFGKAKLLRSREKIVKVTVNWQTTDLEMTLGAAGEAYFIIGENEIPADAADEQTLRRLAEEERIKFPFTLDDDDPTTLNVESIEETVELAEDQTATAAAAAAAAASASGITDDVPFRSSETPFDSFAPPEPELTTSSPILQSQPPPHGAPFPPDSVSPPVEHPGTSSPELTESSLAAAVVATAAAAAAAESSPTEFVQSSQGGGLEDIQIEASLCGHLLQGTNSKAAHDRDVFQANRLDWNALDADPFLWFHPSLVFQFEGQAPYFPARIALPLIASWSMYRKSIGREAFHKLLKGRLVASYDQASASKRGRSRSVQQHAATDRAATTPGGLSSDESGGWNAPTSRALTSRDPFVSSDVGSGMTSVWGCDESACISRMDTLQEVMNCFPNCCSPTVEEAETRFGQVDRISATEPVNVETLARITNQEPTSEVVTDGHPVLVSHAEQPEEGPLASPALVAVTTDRQTSQRKIRRFKKSLKPTSEQLKSLNLKPGPNPVTFSVTSALQGTKTVNGTIYLWPQNAKIVVSDVDGTITRSDVWGQLMPIVGRDWSHPGVAQLFSAVRKSDYKILYLTARAIGQADSTRDYLFGLTQNDKIKLPDGPLVLSPDRLFPTIKREVIDRKPYVFKIAALRDIRNLFPTFYNPFYAGFGNRATDHRAYVHVGIPEARIFIIDPSGHVHHVNKTFAKTYESMSEMAAEMFPPSRASLNEKIPVNEKFNNPNYWRIELPSIVEIQSRLNTSACGTATLAIQNGLPEATIVTPTRSISPEESSLRPATAAAATAEEPPSSRIDPSSPSALSRSTDTDENYSEDEEDHHSVSSFIRGERRRRRRSRPFTTPNHKRPHAQDDLDQGEDRHTADGVSSSFSSATAAAAMGFKLNLQETTSAVFHDYRGEEEEVLLTAREFALDNMYEDTQNTELRDLLSLPRFGHAVRCKKTKQRQIKRRVSEPAGYFTVRRISSDSFISPPPTTLARFQQYRRPQGMFTNKEEEDNQDQSSSYRKTDPPLPPTPGSRFEPDDGGTPSSQSHSSSSEAVLLWQHGQQLPTRRGASRSLHPSRPSDSESGHNSPLAIADSSGTCAMFSTLNDSHVCPPLPADNDKQDTTSAPPERNAFTAATGNRPSFQALDNLWSNLSSFRRSGERPATSGGQPPSENGGEAETQQRSPSISSSSVDT